MCNTMSFNRQKLIFIYMNIVYLWILADWMLGCTNVKHYGLILQKTMADSSNSFF